MEYRDKILHLLVSENLVMVCAVACFAIGLGPWSLAVAPALTLAAGLAKELHDRKTTGFDKWDFVFDAIGTVAGLALIFAATLTT